MAKDGRRAEGRDASWWRAGDAYGAQALRGTCAAFLPSPTRPGFFLWELLAECATSPTAPLRSDIPGPVPLGFVSEVLGTAVPVTCVLHLAGALASVGRDAKLTLESLDPGRRAVVVHQGRRISLAFLCAGLDELCRHPGCAFPAPHPQIAFCDEHLARCSVDTLTALARRWGLAQNLHDSPGHREGRPEAELIARAAAAAGASDRVVGVLVDAAFSQQEHEESAVPPEQRGWALRRAQERERHRLTEIGRVEAHRIRTAAERCASCDSALGPYAEAGVPPHLCSASCAEPGHRTRP